MKMLLVWLMLCAATVTMANTEFIACAGEGQRPPRWVNLRFVQEITPMPQR